MVSTAAGFVSAEFLPLGKNSRGVVADIARVHILKVRGNQLKSEKIILNFFPSKGSNSTEAQNVERQNDKNGVDVPPQRQVFFTSIELEQNLQQLRDLLAELDLALCTDQMTARFVKELTDDGLDTLVVLGAKE